jgi:hypothetical protein
LICVDVWIRRQRIINLTLPVRNLLVVSMNKNKY